MDVISQEMSKLAQVIREKNLTVPTIPFRALSLRRLAVNFDNLVQEKYGDILLYANRTARMEAINNFHVEEIHLEAVMRSQALSQQLDNLVRELVKLGAFIECKMT